MNRIVEAINHATADLPSPEDVAANDRIYTTRDWAGFFAALAAFAQAILPLIVPIFAKTKKD